MDAAVSGPKDETRVFSQTLELARAEFLEMPGLKLTVRQASRLFGTDPMVCQDVLVALVETHLLVRVGDAFARASCS
jgi:hypothetical protein